MADQHRVAAHRAFLDQLNELRERVGGPTLSEIRKLSACVSAKEGKREKLARSTTHDILNGRRKGLPTWSWVALFVSACHAVAVEKRLAVEPLGSLEDWNARWMTARAARQSAEAPLPDAVPAPLASTPGLQPGDTAPSPPVAGETAGIDVAGASALWEEGQRDREVYGRIGARLLAETDAEDPQACMRMAVVALLRDQPTSAYLWLHRAGDAAGMFHRPSMLMAAAELACRYGRDYERAERIGVAMFFYRLAGDHGHAAAAYQLALIQQRKDEEHAATMWSSSSSADPGGYFRTAGKITSSWAQISDPPDKANGVMPIGLIGAPAAVEPSSPAGGPPLAFP